MITKRRVIVFVPFLVFVLFLVLLLSGVIRFHKKEVEVPVVEDIKTVWGFPQDSIRIDTFTVARNQNLSDILFKNGISAQTIDEINTHSKSIFDVRRIRIGNNYYLIHSDSSSCPSHLIYEESPTDYVVFELNDSLSVYRGSRPVETVLKEVNGTIESSLWNAMTDQHISPLLAIDMSDVFAWTIDFFGIQKGDSFKAIYEEKYVNGISIGLGRIHAAVFTHMGEPVYAFYFDRAGQNGYFDKEGKSLKKAFLKAPLSYSRISSRFSGARMHPILKYVRPHYGVDYAAPSGTPVYSIGDGMVVQKSYQAAGGGNYLRIKHNSVYTSQYMHLQGYAKGVTAGARVRQGQLIGYVGMTGLASGPHLDFRIFKNGNPVDPLKVESPPVEPISKENEQVFTHLKDSIINRLQNIPVAGAQGALTQK